MTSNDRVIGIDFGTVSCRVGLYTLDGRQVDFVTESYPTTHANPAWAEQRPEDWWSALCTATNRLVERTGVDPSSIVGIGYDTTSCSVVFARHDGTPVRPSIIWMDVRSGDEAASIAHVDSPAKRVQAGEGGNAEWMPFKALWVKRNQPELWDRTEVLCEFGDWITFQLTGRWTAGFQHIVIRWYYQPHDGGWPTDLYRGLGLEDAIERFPTDIVAAGDPVGVLTAGAAAALGLRPGTTVAQGGVDACVAMIGLDAMRPGQVALITGSSHLQLMHTAQPVYPQGMHGGFPDILVEGLTVVEGGQSSTGSVAAWFRRLFNSAGAELSYRDLDEAAARIPAGAEGLVLLDYWQGNRTPHSDALARGAMWGMTLHHEVGHLWRAILEGTALGTAGNFAVAKDVGVTIDEIRIAGGVCNSPLWMQIHADVTQVPMVRTEVTEAAGLGSGILAAKAAGVYASLTEASAAMVRRADVVEPDPRNAETYAFLLDRYRSTYQQLREDMHLLSQRVGRDAT